MYSIDKNVPTPSSWKQRKLEYPFASMEVGDSFYVADGSNSERYRIYSAGYYFNDKYGKKWKFTVRKDGDGFRVWRTE